MRITCFKSVIFIFALFHSMHCVSQKLPTAVVRQIEKNAALKSREIVRLTNELEKKRQVDVPERIEILNSLFSNYLDLKSFTTAALIVDEMERLHDSYYGKEMDKRKIYRSRARLAFGQENFDESIRNYELSLAIAERIGEKEIAIECNNLSYVHFLSGNSNEGSRYARKAAEIISQKFPEDENLLARIHDNLGIILIDLGNIKQARTLFENNRSVFNRLGLKHKLLQTRIRLVQVSILENNFKGLDDELDELQAEIQQLNIGQFIELEPMFLEQARLLYRKIGDAGRVQKIEDQYQQVILITNNYNLRMLDASMGSIVLLLNSSNDYQKQIDSLRSRNESFDISMKWRNFFIVLLLIGLSYLTIRYYLKRKSVSQRHEIFTREIFNLNMEMERKELEFILKEKAHKDEVYKLKSRALKEKQGLKRTFKKLMEEPINVDEEERGKSEDFLDAIVTDELANSKTLDLIKEKYHHLGIKLNDSHPQLSNHDFELIVLTKEAFTIDQIAGIRQVKADSIRMARKRLKKRLNLRAGDHLDQFIYRL